MPKAVGGHREKILNPASILKLPPGRHTDGGCLYLQVDPSGARRWLVRMMVQGRSRDVGLGSASIVSLAKAREQARDIRRIAREGGDPLAGKVRTTAPTFEAAARECFTGQQDAWRNEKHKTQWIASLEQYAFPTIGALPVDRVDTKELMNVLEPIWTTLPETARRVSQRIGLVLTWSKAKGYRTAGSPTAELKLVMPRHKTAQRHHEALPYQDVPAFIESLRASTAKASTKAALEFVILTACRTGEVLGARFSEINFEAATWTVPAERMKGGREHVVPLSPAAVAIVRTRQEAAKGDLIFANDQGSQLSPRALLALMERMNAEGTPHGFRSSFRDWVSEQTTAPREVAEACLAHVNADRTEAAYARSSMVERRRALMAEWAAFCATKGSATDE